MSKLEKETNDDGVVWNQDHYRGIRIKCDEENPTLLRLIEALYVFVYGCNTKFKHPRGYHIRTRLSGTSTPALYSAILTNYYKGKSRYTPLRFSVKETDDSGLHYHHAIILNDKLDRKSSLQRIHSDLQRKGHLTDYLIIPPEDDWYGQHLTEIDDLHSYFKWMSYLTKTRTKPENGQIWSGCRELTTKLVQWRDAGKPDLHHDKLTTPPKSLRSDLSDFIM